MQGFRLAAISDVEKTKLRRKCCQNFDVKIFKVSGPCNIGQGHRGKVRA